MSLSFIREFKLGGPRGDGRHAYANGDGAFMGRGVPLLERDALGRRQPRDRAVLERLLARGYGVAVDLNWRMTQLSYVAQALNKGDLGLANISLVRMELPPLPSAGHARAMAKADGLLAKYNPDWEEEPRVPGSDPAGGQWTTGGADSPPPTDPSASPTTLASDRPRRYKAVHGLPPDAVRVTLPGCSVISDPKSSTGALMAPPNADYREVYKAGQAIAGDEFSRQISEIRAAVSQGGTYDFQHDPATGEANDSYAAASNYSAGVYMAGAGYSLATTVAMAEAYALRHSRNYGDSDQIGWIIRGWNDAAAGHWK